ncbi:glycogen/starch/alpha-glucan phosphorylase [Aliiroseovarius sp. F47248L]|uniref:glycogen/starch/alpha-glucan phosphorylase n=1 Tax=Aliiroseovarius sp. F47248L TaxID=2926420 RepID=UPI001FF44B05|nr:glycogen/starch/alpha-glucan phosphorylase [Aliiroseovarius sp. F47248L]MCK0140795.1 glycogen/starch/alpha-glucan phosphorylase [Aliiroseovarius sp. F47248L]
MKDFKATGALASAIDFHLAHSVGKTPESASITDWRLALSRAVRDKLITPWFDATHQTYAKDRKRVYYLSMEFLLGRILEDAVNNLGLEDEAKEALAAYDVDFADVVGDEPDAALGNGGLGRLAACFLDSLSCLGIPAHGYGIRYAHGLFRQSFEDGRQMEMAEDWLRHQHNWEFERSECLYDIGFGGQVTEKGKSAVWTPSDTVMAQAYDTPVPGWRASWTNTLRLWSAKPKQIFDLDPFNRGEYMQAAAPEVLAETISRVLYPDDSTEIGKELRLKQEFFFTSASLQDLMRRFLAHNGDLTALPSKVAIQMNDTHPAIAGPELIRQLMDIHGQDFDAAFDIAQGTLHYTNHTLLPEALEAWEVSLMGTILPRHMQLIERIDDRLARDVKASKTGVNAHIVEHDKVNMGTLAFTCARKVNGVSALHTDLMKQTVFSDLHAVYPDRILNQTNGVTPRRWVHGCNPGLRHLLNETIGTEWVLDLEQLKQLAPLVDDPDFRQRFMAVKQENKQRLVDWVSDNLGVEISPDAMFDIQIKRIHEYKRQLMNALETAALANAIRRDPDAAWTPRVKFFGGKAAPAYIDAKNIIRLINDIANSINNDPVIGDRLKVIYPPNYNVSMAEILIPAADLSEQISTAGKEASGTGNMKFALNGAVTIGTLDGANVEIRDCVGDDNIYIFGMTADEVEGAREGYVTQNYIDQSPILSEVIDQIRTGFYSPGDPTRHWPVLEKLLRDDYFMVVADFDAYWDAQRRVDEGFADSDGWARMAVLNTAHSGWFSSDRTIQGYADDIWGVSSLLGDDK